MAPDGTMTALSSGPVNMSGVTAPAAGGTLVLAEPYGGWTATLNGRALQPVATPVDGWAQGFVLPAGGGQLSITRNDLAREASLLAELIVALAVCLLALPGKRADPVEQAEAMAALREARDARRAPGGSRRFARGATRRDDAGAGLADDGLADDGLADDDLAAAEADTADTAGRRGRMRRPGVAIASLGSSRLAVRKFPERSSRYQLTTINSFTKGMCCSNSTRFGFALRLRRHRQRSSGQSGSCVCASRIRAAGRGSTASYPRRSKSSTRSTPRWRKRI